jgi:hypothetical protein
MQVVLEPWAFGHLDGLFVPLVGGRRNFGWQVARPNLSELAPLVALALDARRRRHVLRVDAKPATTASTAPAAPSQQGG